MEQIARSATQETWGSLLILQEQFLVHRACQLGRQPQPFTASHRPVSYLVPDSSSFFAI